MTAPSPEPPALRWRTPAGEWCVVNQSPLVTPGFAEGQPVEFGPASEGLSLFVDDEPLASADGAWEWTPGFFAGQVQAELRHVHGHVTRFLLDVSPDTRKLGKDLFDEMLRDLWDFSPELVLGTEPATIQTGELGVLQEPWIEFARFRRHAADLIQALQAVVERPRRRLRRERAHVLAHRVRRADRTTARTALRTPAVALLRRHESVALERQNYRLDVPVVEDTMDCAPNRTLLAIARSVVRRAESLLTTLSLRLEAERHNETTTPLARRWPARRAFLVETLGSLKQILRREPFCAVQRPQISPEGLTAVAADPAYARAWTLCWAVLRPAGDGSADRVWLSPTWELYERWCFMALGRALMQVPGWQWAWKDGRRGCTGRRGDEEAELLLQPTFNTSPMPRAGFWSVSRQRIPDIVLRVRSGETNRFVVFDAKYRVSRGAVLDAMESAHIYQDSLRLADRRPDASMLLVPAGDGARWLEDDAFLERHGVGVRVVRPGVDAGLPAPAAALLA